MRANKSRVPRAVKDRAGIQHRLGRVRLKKGDHGRETECLASAMAVDQLNGDKMR
jgi:hypothetical protein